MNELLRRHDYKKQFGQNFITDENFLRAIVADAGITDSDTVLEVGAGAGTLTKCIANVAKKAVVFEIDRELAPILNETIGDCDNVEIVFRDVLSVSDDELLGFCGGGYKVVANLPYYITAPTILKFLESRFKPKTMTVMVQAEVAERLIAKAGTAEYGAFTLLVKLYGDVEVVRRAPRTLFYPVPKVDSAVVKITVAPRFLKTEVAGVKRLIKAAFLMRRKTLLNNLTHAGFQKDRAVAALDSAGLPPNVRGEALALDDFVAVWTRLAE